MSESLRITQAEHDEFYGIVGLECASDGSILETLELERSQLITVFKDHLKNISPQYDFRQKSQCRRYNERITEFLFHSVNEQLSMDKGTEVQASGSTYILMAQGHHYLPSAIPEGCSVRGHIAGTIYAQAFSENELHTFLMSSSEPYLEPPAIQMTEPGFYLTLDKSRLVHGRQQAPISSPVLLPLNFPCNLNKVIR